MKFQKISPKVVLIASVSLLVACSKKSENSLNLSKIEQGKIKDGKEEILSKKNLVLSGNQEVPSNLSGATGQFDISYNKSTKMLKYTINWSGLTGPAAAAHIHGEAPAGANQSVKHHIKISAAAAGMYSDSVLVDEISIKEAGLLNGLYYINIHTEKYPGGEIRGQIDFKKCDVLIVKRGLKMCSAFEVPANNSKATGKIDVSYNKTHKVLTYTITWKSLTDKPAAAHIHGEAAKG